ncbi:MULTISPECIES: hypothetical protein [unclassified Acinetobacter]|uniref:hypothetical protein n=1 Tax=unclassified Acinetobacter TaxID=196816 RepID=UPI0015D3E041|nr:MULTISPECIES: hypothetical protein [unclassified Acinetobacter]
MKKILFPVLIGMIALLSACGGGGGSNVDSSYSKTIIQNGVTYECKSENAANACGSASRDCSACDLKTPSTNVITAICTQPVANTHKVTTAGCVLKLTNDTQTGICTSEGLRLLSGSNRTKEEVNQGALFTNGSLKITLANNVTETITCN